jgi:hypothetical protein
MYPCVCVCVCVVCVCVTLSHIHCWFSMYYLSIYWDGVSWILIGGIGFHKWRWRWERKWEILMVDSVTRRGVYLLYEYVIRLEKGVWYFVLVLRFQFTYHTGYKLLVLLFNLSFFTFLEKVKLWGSFLLISRIIIV